MKRAVVEGICMYTSSATALYVYDKQYAGGSIWIIKKQKIE